MKDLQSENLPKAEILKTLYLERYPIFEITRALGIDSSELQEMSKRLKLFLLRCPLGHRFPDDPALHAQDAHYCIRCERWFNEATLKDEIELEIRRLREKEASN
ncbi:MAG: hypothetical protein ACE5NN_02820 [Candidatus Bathyarchaeia archaeon]